MTPPTVGVLGATGLVGHCLLQQLAAADTHTIGFSRRPVPPGEGALSWQQLAGEQTAVGRPIAWWVSAAPLWCLPDYFRLFEAAGAQRIVALSSTSLLTKADSPDAGERRVARALADAETRLAEWAAEKHLAYTLLRPTMIYGLGRDRNVTRIARFVRRFGCFPLLPPATGLRQPVHAADVAGACIAALTATGPLQSTYALAGGETLSLRELVSRIFVALQRRPRLLEVPGPALRAGSAVMRLLPRTLQVNMAMFERMNQDLVFDHAAAVRDLGYTPRGFAPTAADLGQ